MNHLTKIKDKLASIKMPSKPLVEDHVKEERMNICRSCPEMYQPTQQCKKCFCFLPAKTALAGTSCPLKKW